MSFAIRLVSFSSKKTCIRQISKTTNKHLILRLSNSRAQSTASSHKLIGDDFIVKSIYPHLEKCTGVTLPELVWENMASKENKPAFECSITGQKMTHGDVYKTSRAFAAALIKAGLKRGDCVAIVSPNKPEFVACLLGVLHAGGILSTANPGYTAEEIERQVIISQAKMVITVPSFLPTIRSVKGKCSTLKSIIVIGEPHEGCHTFSEMIKTDPTGVEFMKGSQIDTEKTVAILPFSSGTTGVPKGVELTHSNLCTNVIQHTHTDFAFINRVYEGEDADRMIGLLPFYHIYALTAIILAGHYNGAHILTIPKFQPESFVQVLKDFKPTILTLVPPVLLFLANSPDVTKNEFESVRCIQVGAAPTGLSLTKKLLGKADKYLCFQEMYGLSETSPAAIIMNPSKKNSKLGSCGSLVPGTLGKVIDVESGKILGPNQRGELLLKGPQVMKGYFNNAEATKQCIDEDDWFHTGDIAYYDSDGYFYVVDRLKELIKVKGLQVAPAELEDLLRKRPDIADVAVIGIPDERSGELPRAYIVKKSNSLTDADIHKYLEGKVSKYKELKGGIEFVDAIPKSPAGKILRRELKADYLAKHGSN